MSKYLKKYSTLFFFFLLIVSSLVGIESRQIVASSTNERIKDFIVSSESIDLKDTKIEPQTKELIEETLQYVTKNNIPFEYRSEWWIWSLSHIDTTISSNYLTSLEEIVKEQSLENFDGLEIQKVIIALTLEGRDATDFIGYNLINIMLEKNLQNINDYVYTLLAIDSNNYEVPQGSREGLIDEIVAKENEMGGWSFVGDIPSVDLTGMVLSSLAPYKEEPKIKKIINRAVSFLSEAQKENGGYFEKMNGGDTSESVSQAIIGLASIGVDPSSESFTKTGGNLVQHLMEFKQEDNGYSHTIKDEESMEVSTQQALLAYVAYDKYIDHTGSIYQKDHSESQLIKLNESDKVIGGKIYITLLLIVLVLVIGSVYIIKKKK